MTPNRIAVALTAVAGLCGAIAPAVANLDWTSTAGLAAGLLTILGVANKWLEGWQKHEARQPVGLDHDDVLEPGDPEHPLVADLPTVVPDEPDHDDLKVAEHG